MAGSHRLGFPTKGYGVQRTVGGMLSPSPLYGTCPLTALLQALRRYFNEQGRVRGPPPLPEQIGGRKWDALRVCGVVFRESIDAMVFEGTGMRSGDPRGYLGHRMKCRTVYFWKLPQEERQHLAALAKDWQGEGAPVQQKTECGASFAS